VETNTLVAASRIGLLESIEQRVLWLSTAMVDHANNVRVNESGLKVGGHQASSASMTSIMTALWFEHLRPEDRVSVKPHASPVLHAINYLLGQLDARHLTTLREGWDLNQGAGGKAQRVARQPNLNRPGFAGAPASVRVG
jgi:pyruvate dehydrogenase E1 component